MKNLFIIVVFAVVAGLSLAGCGDKADDVIVEVVKTKAEIEAEKAKADQEKWRAIIAKKESGESSPTDGQRQERPKDRPEVKEGRGFSTFRLEYVRKNGLPGNYASLSTPLKGSREDKVKGRELYNRNCAACHGVRGDGESAMGRRLKPSASNLLMVSDLPEATDGYLFWAVSDGGRGIRPPTPMPSFRQLSEDDKWRIIGALRKGLR